MNHEPADDHVADAESAAETPDDRGDADAAKLAEQIGQLLDRGRGGANWFFWIAGLSLINTAIMHSGGDRQYALGLGTTKLVDLIAREVAVQQPEISTVVMAGAIGFSIFCSLLACLFGWLSRKRILILFGLGMTAYLLDGLLFVLIHDWLSLGFHAYALYCMWTGLAAYRELNRCEAQIAEGQG
ncbi:MAG: hypothetical protein SFV23_06765 [Planctomycetaceae bacterium]|nr:hypothetical protein [Planctomycetaceae bacterium]